MEWWKAANVACKGAISLKGGKKPRRISTLAHLRALAGDEAGGYWLDPDILPFMWVFPFFFNAEGCIRIRSSSS